jgi:hypothetical protein
LASTIVLHLKSHPTFVSDAISKDVEQTIDFSQNLQPDIKKFGQRLHSHLAANRLQLQDDPFGLHRLVFGNAGKRQAKARPT